MCFSAEASFISSGVLTLAGLYAIRKTLTSQHKNFILVALIPLLFAIQQFSEGFVWVFLQTQNEIGWKIASYFFLFFALVVWPSWIPLSLSRIDPDRKIVFYILFIIGVVYGVLAYIPMIIYPDIVETNICNHSICYSQMHPFRSPIALIIYLVLTIGSTFICSWKFIRYLGILISGSAIVSYLFYSYAFVSVWCFFSAVISVFIGIIAYKLDDFAENK